MKLSQLIKQDRFASTAQETLLSVLVTSSWLMSELSATMTPFGLTPAQYNVLRILRGSAPERLTCSDIGHRLLDRTPDVTRLLGRMERNGLVERERASYDRRVVEVGITRKGMALLERIDPAVEATQERVTSYLSDDERRKLIDLLEQLRTAQGEP